MLFQNWGISVRSPPRPSILPDPGLPILWSSSLWSDNDPWPGVIAGMASASPGPPCPGLALRGTQMLEGRKSLSGGMLEALAAPHSSHQESNAEAGVPLGAQGPLPPHGPLRALRSRPPPPFPTGDGAASAGRTKQFSRPSGARQDNLNMGQTSGLCEAAERTT